jgi:hypothetical protein
VTRLIDARADGGMIEVRDGVGHRYAFAYLHMRGFATSSWEVWRQGGRPTDWACTQVRTGEQAVALLREWFPAAVT